MMIRDTTAAKPAGERLISEIESKNGLSRAVQVLLDGLEALDSRDQPDWRTRQESARQIMDRVDGKAIERQLVQHQHIKAPVDPKKLFENPATMEAILRQVAGTEAGDKLLAALSAKQAKGKSVDR